MHHLNKKFHSEKSDQVSLNCTTQGEKLILIPGCHKNHYVNRFPDSFQNLQPCNVLWSSGSLVDLVSPSSSVDTFYWNPYRHSRALRVWLIDYSWLLTISAVWPLKVWKHLPVSELHNLQVLSKEPVAILSLWGKIKTKTK